MKKKLLIVASFFIFICLNACTGYKPIYSSSNVHFTIADYSIKGDKKLGNQIYSKLLNISKYNKNNPTAQSIKISIETSKEKIATVKNAAGKIIEYKINLNAFINVEDYLTDKSLLNQNLNYSSSYKVQELHSETVILEKKTTENLVNQIYENLLIRITENISAK
tara:strand:- start:2637 stop:3131 length:495 start_codon:yes stop_codon:yes gene_type:complete